MAEEQETIKMNEDQNLQDDEENLQDDEDGAEISKQFMEEQKRAAEIMKLPQAPIDRIVREMLPPGIHVSKVDSRRGHFLMHKIHLFSPNVAILSPAF